MFKHFLITRFNLKNFPQGEKKEEDWRCWTKERIELFTRYCLPSIINQNNKNFTWLLYFDADTPAEFQSIFDYLGTYPYIKVCFAKGMSDFERKYLSDIQTMAGSCQWLMLSRMDNDDCLEADAIEVIQKNFKAKDKYLLSLASGYTLDLNKKILSHYYYPMSPFITIIESNKKTTLNGIFCKPHSSWDELRLFVVKELFKLNKKSKFILDKPYWIQIVHEGNVSNSFRRGLPVMKTLSLTNFGLNLRCNKQGFTTIPNYLNYVVWKRYFKASVVKWLAG